jgi:hypothetical protein
MVMKWTSGATVKSHSIGWCEPWRYETTAPTIEETESDAAFRVLTLDALVRMKLTSFRRKDQGHLLNMIDVGLIDDTWLGSVPSQLADRLKELLNNPGS